MPVPEDASDAQRAPRVGLTGAWFDPYDLRTWSGSFRHVIDVLVDMGVFAGYRDATPWGPGTRLLHRARRVTGRAGTGWPLGWDMRWLARASNAVARRNIDPGVDAWIVPAGGFGRPVGGRVVSWFELAPAELAALGPDAAASFGYQGASERGLTWVVEEHRRLHRAAHACCATSHASAASLALDGVDPARIHVVGFGRNVDVAAPPQRDWNAPRFLFVGNDWKRKNGELVVRAFSRLLSEVPHARLDVVGIHPRIDQTGVHPHGPLPFFEAGPGATLGSLFSSATCFVMPSSWEPFGIVYVEAGAAGVPSIAADAGGTRTSVGDAGILVPPGDEAALLAAMRTLADPVRAQEYSARAVARAGLFTWRQVAERLLRASGLAPDLPLADYL